VYCDNFFSSPALFLNLRRKGIGAYGTVRANRKGLPAEMKPQVFKMKTGEEPKFWVNAEKSVLSYTCQDTGHVSLLSTVYDTNTSQINVVEKRSVWFLNCNKTHTCCQVQPVHEWG
jgi:hypothetical protein